MQNENVKSKQWRTKRNERTGWIALAKFYANFCIQAYVHVVVELWECKVVSENIYVYVEYCNWKIVFAKIVKDFDSV